MIDGDVRGERPEGRAGPEQAEIFAGVVEEAVIRTENLRAGGNGRARRGGHGQNQNVAPGGDDRAGREGETDAVERPAGDIDGAAGHVAELDILGAAAPGGVPTLGCALAAEREADVSEVKSCLPVDLT